VRMWSLLFFLVCACVRGCRLRLQEFITQQAPAPNDTAAALQWLNHQLYLRVLKTKLPEGLDSSRIAHGRWRTNTHVPTHTFQGNFKQGLVFGYPPSSRHLQCLTLADQDSVSNSIFTMPLVLMCLCMRMFVPVFACARSCVWRACVQSVRLTLMTLLLLLDCVQIMHSTFPGRLWLKKDGLFEISVTLRGPGLVTHLHLPILYSIWPSPSRSILTLSSCALTRSCVALVDQVLSHISRLQKATLELLGRIGWTRCHMRPHAVPHAATCGHNGPIETSVV
jgi:hypothetical protein